MGNITRKNKLVFLPILLIVLIVAVCVWIEIDYMDSRPHRPDGLIILSGLGGGLHDAWDGMIHLNGRDFSIGIRMMWETLPGKLIIMALLLLLLLQVILIIFNKTTKLFASFSREKSARRK